MLGSAREIFALSLLTHPANLAKQWFTALTLELLRGAAKHKMLEPQLPPGS